MSYIYIYTYIFPTSWWFSWWLKPSLFWKKQTPQVFIGPFNKKNLPKCPRRKIYGPTAWHTSHHEKKGPLSSHSGTEREAWLPPGKPTYYIDWRNPAAVEVGSLSHYVFQGFIHVVWCRISQPSTVAMEYPPFSSGNTSSIRGPFLWTYQNVPKYTRMKWN